jgi:hypothetical protein
MVKLLVSATTDGHERSNPRRSVFTLGRRTLVPTEQEAGSTPQPVWQFRKKEKSLRSAVKSPG